jgi:hypothetical protein
LTDRSRKPIEFNRIKVKTQTPTAVDFSMIFHRDAKKTSKYQWKFSGQSHPKILVLGTTGIGPVQGVQSHPSKGSLQVTVPNELRGKREWLKFEIRQDDVVIREAFLFLIAE